MAECFDIEAELPQILISFDNVVFRHREAELFECVEFHIVGIEVAANRFISKKAEMIFSRFFGIFLFEAAYSQIPRTDFVSFKSLERIQWHIHLATNFEIDGIDMLGNCIDITDVCRDIFTDIAVATRRSNLQIPVFVIDEAAG